MTFVSAIERAELEQNLDSVVQRHEIDSPHSRHALNTLLDQHPAIVNVRLYKQGGAGRIETHPGTAAVILATVGRGPNRRLKVNGVRVHAAETRKAGASQELLCARQAADRINQQIKLGHTIEFWSEFVKLTFPVDRAYVGEYSLFMDAGPFGEIAVAPQHYHCFSGIDLSDLGHTDHGVK
jgi:hypothetical protein